MFLCQSAKASGILVLIRTQAKLVANLHLLEEYGNLAREPLSKELEDGIFELRTIEGNDIVSAKIIWADFSVKCDDAAYLMSISGTDIETWRKTRKGPGL